MAWRFSSVMDVSSWLAALIVVMYHIRFLLFVDYANVKDTTIFIKAFYFLTGLGQEAFIVFFAIGGLSFGQRFLKHWNARGSREVGTIRTAFVRTYTTLVVAVLLGAALDLLGVRYFNGSGLYTNFPDFVRVNFDFATLVGNMLMLQAIVVPTYGGNGLLFLMSYAWWYGAIVVLMFILFHSNRRIGNVVAVAALIALLLTLLRLPSDFSLYLPVWLFGVAAIWMGQSRYPKPRPSLAFVIFVSAIILSRMVTAKTAAAGWPIYLSPLGYIVVGMAFSMLIISVDGASAETVHRDRLGPDFDRLNRRLAATSYLTYFSHFPFMLLIVGAAADVFNLALKQQPGGGVLMAFFAALLLIYCYAFLFSRVAERCAGAAQAYLESRFLWRAQNLPKIEG